MNKNITAAAAASGGVRDKTIENKTKTKTKDKKSKSLTNALNRMITQNST